MRGGGRRIVVQLNVPQAVVRMGGAGIMRKDPDFIPAYVVNHILGGGSFTSRLYDEVREKRGLAYGVYSYLLTLRHAAMFMACTQTQADSTARGAGADRGAGPAHGRRTARPRTNSPRPRPISRAPMR